MLGPTFRRAVGRYRPRCGGLCVTAEVEEESTVEWTVGLVVLPPLLCLTFTLPRIAQHAHSPALVPCLAGLVLLCLFSSLLLLARTMLTEPGILLVADVMDEGDEDKESSYLHDDGRKAAPISSPCRDETLESAIVILTMCRQTDCCIDRFDHFCPWVGNAIGRRNYRPFIFFLVSVLALCLSVNLVSVMRITTASNQSRDRVDGMFDSAGGCPLALGLFLLTVVSFMSLGGLLSYHLWLISVGMTTNEHFRGTWRRKANPHDRGFFQNWAHFLCDTTPPSFLQQSEQDSLLIDIESDSEVVGYSLNQLS